MKGYRTTKLFDHHFRARISRDERLIRDFRESVEAFLEDRTLVYDHALSNVMQGKRAFSINKAYRVVYIDKEEYYQFIDIGTHEQVYRSS